MNRRAGGIPTQMTVTETSGTRELVRKLPARKSTHSIIWGVTRRKVKKTKQESNNWNREECELSGLRLVQVTDAQYARADAYTHARTHA